MKRKLLLLNLAMLALIAALAWRLRVHWLEARARERAILEQRSRPAAVPPVTPSPPAAPLTAADYADIAQRVLFSQDRNPDVILEKAPPKPLPPFPSAHGVLDIGAGPTAILTEKPGAAQRGFRVGETVGEYKLVAIKPAELTFEWDGKLISKRLEELQARETAPAPEAPAAPPPAAATTIASPAAAATGPGADIGGQMRACQPGDTTPPGAVVDGYRKVVSETPFGKACRWEQVK